MSYNEFTPAPDVANEITYWMSEVQRWKSLINEKDSEIAKLRHVCDIRYAVIKEVIKHINRYGEAADINWIKATLNRGLDGYSTRT